MPEVGQPDFETGGSLNWFPLLYSSRHVVVMFDEVEVDLFDAVLKAHIVDPCIDLPADDFLLHVCRSKAFQAAFFVAAYTHRVLDNGFNRRSVVVELSARLQPLEGLLETDVPPNPRRQVFIHICIYVRRRVAPDQGRRQARAQDRGTCAEARAGERPRRYR